MLSVGCWWSSVVWWPHVSAGNTAEDPDPFNTIRLIITKTCTPGIIRSNNTAQSSTPPGIVFKLSLEACCYSLNMFNCFYESCEQKFFCFIVHGLHNHIHITWDNLLLWSEQTCNKRFLECGMPSSNMISYFIFFIEWAFQTSCLHLKVRCFSTNIFTNKQL